MANFTDCKYADNDDSTGEFAQLWVLVSTTEQSTVVASGHAHGATSRLL